MKYKTLIKNILKEVTAERVAWTMVSIGIICFLVYFLTMALSGYKMFGNLVDADIEVTGQIGDFFGGVVGSIWALAGVLLYFSALKLQNKQLIAQQEDMAQNKSLMSQQQFENIYFGLLRTQQELKSELKGIFYSIVRNKTSYQVANGEYDANKFFYRLLNEMHLLYKVYRREHYNSWNKEAVDQELEYYYLRRESEEDDPNFDYVQEIRDMFDRYNLSYLTYRYRVKKETVEKAQHKDTEELMCKCIYGHVFIAYQEQLGHYFRHLYNIVKFLDKEKKACLKDIMGKAEEIQLSTQIDRRFEGYFSFIHSMLSTSELAILFYNSLLFPKAEKLYIEYHMFDNLLQEKLLNKEHAKLIEGATLKDNRSVFQEIIKDL